MIYTRIRIMISSTYKQQLGLVVTKRTNKNKIAN